jgi:hypothetical protein
VEVTISSMRISGLLGFAAVVLAAAQASAEAGAE